jgi:hypothetical protein
MACAGVAGPVASDPTSAQHVDNRRDHMTPRKSSIGQGTRPNNHVKADGNVTSMATGCLRTSE